MTKEQIIRLLQQQPGDGEVRIETHPKCVPQQDRDGIFSHRVMYVGAHDNEGRFVIVAMCACSRSSEDETIRFWKQCR